MIKELEDYTWFPDIFRKWQLEFVGNISVWTKLYKPLVAVLQQMVSDHQLISLQDLCSGSGMPAIYVHHQSDSTLPLQLSDKFPQTDFKNGNNIFYVADSVDALTMEPAKNVGYTMYNAFHHFSNTQQKALVQKMAANEAPLMIAEVLQPGLLNVVKIFFTATVIQLFTAPFVKPFSLGRLLFTYIIPVNIVTVAYDGIISVLRSKSVSQYREELKHLSTRSYQITVHSQNNWKGNLVYLKGTPTNS